MNLIFNFEVPMKKSVINPTRLGGLCLAFALLSATAQPFNKPATAPPTALPPISRALDGREYIRNEVKVTLRDQFALELQQASGRGRPLNHDLLRGLHPAIESILSRHSNGRAFLNGEDAPDHIKRREGEQVPRLARKLTFVLHPNTDAATVLEELRSLPQIESASLSELLTPHLIPPDPGFAQQWAPGIIGLTNAWNVTPRGVIRVAIVDTGVDLDHPDLASGIVVARGGFGDFAGGDAPTDGRSAYDHGTHVAGIVGAAFNSAGVVGFGNQILLLVFNCATWNAGAGQYRIGNSDDAINQAITDGANVINCSFGSTPGSLSASMLEVLDDAYNHNILVVCSAGNEARDMTGNYWDQHHAPFIIAATTSADAFDASYSNYGAGIDLAAPGTTIYSTIPLTPMPPGGVAYGFNSGTSMAAPMVSGAAALVMSMSPDLLDDHSVRHLLIRMAADLGAPGKDAQFGWGRLNLSESALRILRSAHSFVSPVDNTGGDNGDYDQPWASLPAAFANAPDGAVIVLNGGDVDTAAYHYPAQTLNKRCTLTALPDRPVVIGQ